MKAEVYNFREDLFDLIEELRFKDEIKDLSSNPIITPFFKTAIQTFAASMKEEKKKFYVITRESKLLLDKALFKKNYAGSRHVTLHSYPFDFWELATHQEIFDQIVMIDKKKGLLKQVGGIPARPLRENIEFRLIHHNLPPFISTKQIEVEQNFKAVKMLNKDLEFMQPILEKVRSQVFGEGIT